MFAYLFLASLEPGCNEHQRTLILPASCAYMRRSRPAENLRITPKLQVYFTNIFGFLNKAPLVATCCPPCNQTMFLLQHVWLHTKKRLIFAVVAKSRITQMFAVCSEERMKNANTQHFQPFRRNVAYYVALLKQLFDVFFCPYRLFGQVPKHKLNASTQPLSTNTINDIRWVNIFCIAQLQEIPQSASTTKFAEKADPNSCCNSTVFFRRWKSIPAKDLESIFIICHNLKLTEKRNIIMSYNIISTHVLSTGTCFFKKNGTYTCTWRFQGLPISPHSDVLEPGPRNRVDRPLGLLGFSCFTIREGSGSRRHPKQTYEPMVLYIIYLNIFHFSTFHYCNWSSQPDGPKSSRYPSFVEVHSEKIRWT